MEHWYRVLLEEGGSAWGKRAPEGHEEARGAPGHGHVHSPQTLPARPHLRPALWEGSNPGDWLEEQIGLGRRDTGRTHAPEGTFHSPVHSTNLN